MQTTVHQTVPPSNQAVGPLQALAGHAERLHFILRQSASSHGILRPTLTRYASTFPLMLRAVTRAANAKSAMLTELLTFDLSTRHWYRTERKLTIGEKLHESRTVRFNHNLLTRVPISVLPAASPVAKEETRHPHLSLHLRTTVDRVPSRPSMQFTQTATANQPEVLAAIQNVEKAISKVQLVSAPAPHTAADVQQLTVQVYDQLEKQLRIERERRGR